MAHRHRRLPWFTAPLLVGALTVAVLWPVTGNGFIDLDDSRHLTGNRLAHAILGREALQEGRAADGLRHLGEAVRLESRDSRVWFDYGLALLKAGDGSGAAGAFDRAAALDPDSGEARAFRDHARRSAAAPGSGDVPAAVRAW